MNVFLLLLITTSTLVLRSGDRITVEGAVREDNGVITFRSNGQLYSMPLLEVVRIEATDSDRAQVVDLQGHVVGQRVLPRVGQAVLPHDPAVQRHRGQA